MECDRVRIALSARLDGEESDLSVDLVDAHLRRCTDCRAYLDAIEATVVSGRAARDIADAVASVAPHTDRSGVWIVLRVALVVVAASELVLAIPDLLWAHAEHGDEHLARHVGAFAFAFAIGLIFVAVRPSRARALVPITAALAIAMIGGAITDAARGDTPVFTEFEHVLEVFGLVLVWLLATRRGWPGPAIARAEADAGTPVGAAPPFRPRVVADPEEAAEARRVG